MNKVILMGRLTKDADVKNEDSDNIVAKFTFAVERSYKKDDEDNADFIRCVAFKNQAKFLSEYGKQGVKFLLEGRLKSGSYDKEDGTKVFTTDVIVDKLEFAESKKVSSEAAGGEAGGFARIPDGEDMPFR